MKNIKGGGVFLREEVLADFEIWKDKILKRENNWDIKIVQYILDNFKQKKLFYKSGYPTNDILKEISVQILNILNLDCTLGEVSDMLDTFEILVYGCIKRYLELDFEEEYLRFRGIMTLKGEKYTLKEYIEEYRRTCKYSMMENI